MMIFHNLQNLTWSLRNMSQGLQDKQLVDLEIVSAKIGYNNSNKFNSKTSNSKMLKKMKMMILFE